MHRRVRLGSILSQYAFARVLAQRFAYRLATVPVPGFPGTLTASHGEEILGPLIRWNGQWPFDAYSGRPLLLDELYQAPGAQIRLHGGFQRYDLFASESEAICDEWLRLPDSRPRLSIADFVIGLDTDRRDFLTLDGSLSELEIRRLVRTVSHKRLYLLTDSLTNPMVKQLSDLNAEVVVKREMDSLLFIQSFQKIALGQSALHWWGAFLGKAKEIYFPKIDRGPWSHPEPTMLAVDPEHYGIDLRVMGQERWIYHW